MNELALYDAACRALHQAVTVDEVKEYFSKVDAIRVYARQAKNKQLENDAKIIRWRAIRRMGEIMEAEPKAKGGKPYQENPTGGENPPVRTLDDAGIDKDLAKLARKYAAMEETSFDRLISRCREHNDGTEKLPLDILAAETKAAADTKRKTEHANRTMQGGTVDDLHKLAASGFKAGAILADPPWHFMARSDKGEGRSASGHYTTDRRWKDIIELPVAQLAAPDCTLLMWMVDWCPKLALEVIEAWGFAHKTTAFTWVKLTQGHDGKPRADVIGDGDFHFGMGYWTRANPEDCWLATRGHPKRINADVRQLLVNPLMEHSRKPDEVHDRIERLVDGPYLELYARRERPGWLTWGNELKFELPPHDPETGEVIEEPIPVRSVAIDDPSLELPEFLRRKPDNSFETVAL